MNRVLPILFNTEMVRAIQDRRKTVTRRVILPHNRRKAKEQGYSQGYGLWVDPSTDNGDRDGHIKDYSISSCWMSFRWYINKYAPYRSGDILYVRETWGDYRECSEGGCGYYMYRVDYPEGATTYLYNDGTVCDLPKWNPSIHMPKKAARIWLKVTDVRVGRLQDMDCEDAMREGIDSRLCVNLAHTVVKFKKLWNLTLKKADIDRYGWDANPWVWVIEFKRCEKPES